MRKKDLLYDKFEQLKLSLIHFDASRKSLPLLWSVYDTFKLEIIVLVLGEILMISISCLQPVLLKLIIDYIKAGGQNGVTYTGLGLVFGYCANEMLERFGNSHKNLFKSVNGQKAKNLVRALIFEKLTKSSSATNKDFAEG